MIERTKELKGKDWLSLLNKKSTFSKERVIFVARLNRTLKLSKKALASHFPSWEGFDFRQGKEIELVSAKEGGAGREIPQFAWDRLTSIPGSHICITLRSGQYFVKTLRLIECSTTVPGTSITDSFNLDSVERSYAVLTDLSRITEDGVDRLFSLMDKFRWNPIDPFKEIPGRIGILARREFLGGNTKADDAEIVRYRVELERLQLPNGSWDNNVVTTAFNLISLIELGVTTDDSVITRGTNWILSMNEPFGFPGLFMLTNTHTERFNSWKEKQEKGKSLRSSSRNTTAKEVRDYLSNRDMLSSISRPPCELRMTWASGIAVEALLRCGLHREKRTIRCINTLLTMSNGHSWCGCGYFDTREKNYIPDDSSPVNFNRFPVWDTNRRHGFDWYTDKNEIASFVSDNQERSSLQVGPKKALLVRNYSSTGECGMVIQRALSFHPDYHGSNFETNVALSCTQHQSWNGTWADIYQSTAINHLGRSIHPLTKFLLIRSIPNLIRQQQKNGLWQEKAKCGCQPPSEAETSFIFLRALKKFDYLERLL